MEAQKRKKLNATNSNTKDFGCQVEPAVRDTAEERKLEDADMEQYMTGCCREEDCNADDSAGEGSP